ncbi:MAG: DUF2877 domain-containing protein [Synergistaceae bacterium]|nr:DUF2877 domain-containing protein [Synergistaceae bacterium]
MAEVHSSAVNCFDGRSRRWTLITDEREFQPRSVLVEKLPEVAGGSGLALELRGARILFDAKQLSIRPNPRWSGIVREWFSLLDDPALSSLREGVHSVRDLTELSGLGPGLTPAGDDYIAGWMTAVRCAPSERSSARLLVRSFCSGWSPERTTPLAGWMIKDAARGRIWRRGKTLLASLEGSDASRLLSAAGEILSWGHTSGMAWLAGLSAGFVKARRV